MSYFGISQKQLSRGFLKKSCSENLQQIYRRTLMPKCNFNKVALQLYWNHTLAWLFSCKLAAYFQNTFLQQHPWTAASECSSWWSKPLTNDLQLRQGLILIEIDRELWSHPFAWVFPCKFPAYFQNNIS